MVVVFSALPIVTFAVLVPVLMLVAPLTLALILVALRVFPLAQHVPPPLMPQSLRHRPRLVRCQVVAK